MPRRTDGTLPEMVTRRLEEVGVGGREGDTGFHTAGEPGIGVRDYLERMREHAGVSDECYVAACVYMDRVVRRSVEVEMGLNTVHRLVLAGVLAAAKYHDDVRYSNAFFAKVGGVRTSSLNSLEREFLSALDFDLYISQAEYEHYLTSLQGTRREPMADCRYIVPVKYESPTLCFRRM
eukprot:TRINITY_DN21489_c0_g1_i1.p1 TRINITY_DN21489_c0_g1~~TRINITY_DN21489_c0_g1_i1.p1  ORF type:complete len:190 (+),score=36.60 TRINITY_DN21489_c0_g1_i1:37-570(+)